MFGSERNGKILESWEDIARNDEVDNKWCPSKSKQAYKHIPIKYHGVTYTPLQVKCGPQYTMVVCQLEDNESEKQVQRNLNYESSDDENEDMLGPSAMMGTLEKYSAINKNKNRDEETMLMFPEEQDKTGEYERIPKYYNLKQIVSYNSKYCKNIDTGKQLQNDEDEDDSEDDEQPIYFESRLVDSILFEKCMKGLIEDSQYKDLIESEYKNLKPKIVDDFINKNKTASN